MSGASNLLPPRKRDWEKGVPQVGAFLRAKDGASIQFVRDRVDDTDVALWLDQHHAATGEKV